MPVQGIQSNRYGMAALRFSQKRSNVASMSAKIQQPFAQKKESASLTARVMGTLSDAASAVAHVVCDVRDAVMGKNSVAKKSGAVRPEMAMADSARRAEVHYTPQVKTERLRPSCYTLPWVGDTTRIGVIGHEDITEWLSDTEFMAMGQKFKVTGFNKIVPCKD